MVLKGIYVGIGGFGKNFGIDIYKYLLEHPVYSRQMKGIICSDLYLAEDFNSRLQRLGLFHKPDEIYLEIERIPTAIKYYAISLPNVETGFIPAGVGKFWVRAISYAEVNKETFFQFLTESPDLNIVDISFIVMGASGGGGTGCGTIPVWARYIFSKFPSYLNIDPLHIFMPVVSVLPFSGEWGGISEPNAASLLGRLWRITKTIILADNDLFGRELSSEQAQREVNFRLVSSLISLMSASLYGGLEAADFNKMFSIGSRASIAIPAIREFNLDFLKKWEDSIKMAIQITLIDNILAKIDLEKGIKRIYIFLILPYSVDIHEKEIAELPEFIESIVSVEERPMIFVIKDPELFRRFIVSIFIIDPYVPRLIDIYFKLKRRIEDRLSLRRYIESMTSSLSDEVKREIKIEETENIIRNAFQQYENFLEIYLADFGEKLDESLVKENSFIIPYDISPKRTIMFHPRIRRKISVDIITENIVWKGEIEEMEDRTGEDMINTLFKVLSKRLNAPISPISRLEIKVKIDGQWFYLTPGVLKMLLKDYPPLEKMFISDRKVSRYTVLCPKCGNMFEVY